MEAFWGLHTAVYSDNMMMTDVKLLSTNLPTIYTMYHQQEECYTEGYCSLNVVYVCQKEGTIE
jgi:hypothetical protein